MLANLNEYLAEHPRMLRGITLALVAYSGFVFFRAVKMDYRVSQHLADLKGAAQKAASEALGG